MPTLPPTSNDGTPAELPVVLSTRPYTTDLAEFAAKLNYSDLSENLIQKALFSVQDCIGLTLYVGQKTGCGRAIVRYALAESGKAEATIVGYGKKASAELAALANGTLALGLEYEDVHIGSASHPYATIVPAALAAAERLGSNGRELLTAVVVGHEIACRVGTAAACKTRGGEYMGWRRGLYPQQIFNVFGAAAAAAKLLKLNSSDTAMALGIAGEQAAGSHQSHDEGVFSRRLHGGLAAANGVRASLLVASGFSGPKQILEGRYNFYEAMDLHFDADGLVGGLGTRWEFLDIWYKAYPSYTISHAMIEGLIQLLREHKIAPTDVDRIIGYQAVWSQSHLRRDWPTQVSAQYGPRFLLATTLMRGRLGLEEVQEKTLKDPDIHEFARDKVDIVIDERYTKLRDETPPPRVWPGAVTVLLKNGRKLHTEVLHPLGSPGNPMSKEQMRAKFMSLVASSGLFGDVNAERLYERVQSLRDGSPVADVTVLLQPAT